VTDLRSLLVDSIGQMFSGAGAVVIEDCQDITFDHLSIKIEDNGKGFSIKNSGSEESYGLKNMKTRAAEVNASFEIHSNVGSGTRVVATLRLK
jgi:nitrate/nitrite-specific signal transduction histidine kinase